MRFLASPSQGARLPSTKSNHELREPVSTSARFQKGPKNPKPAKREGHPVHLDSFDKGTFMGVIAIKRKARDSNPGRQAPGQSGTGRISKKKLAGSACIRLTTRNVFR